MKPARSRRRDSRKSANKGGGKFARGVWSVLERIPDPNSKHSVGEPPGPRPKGPESLLATTPRSWIPNPRAARRGRLTVRGDSRDHSKKPRPVHCNLPRPHQEDARSRSPSIRTLSARGSISDSHSSAKGNRWVRPSCGTQEPSAEGSVWEIPAALLPRSENAIRPQGPGFTNRSSRWCSGHCIRPREGRNELICQPAAKRTSRKLSAATTRPLLHRTGTATRPLGNGFLCGFLGSPLALDSDGLRRSNPP